MDSTGFIYQKRRWTGATRHDAVARHGMVAAKHPLIGEAGVSMMKRGGNAVDAAVAAAFMNTIVEPAMNGIGGEGVMTIHLESGENIVVDYVGRPAESSSPEMYKLEESTEAGWMGWRKVKNDENLLGPKACTVPGTVAGLTEALERYGTLKLSEVMAPAIKTAEQGFTMGAWTADHIFKAMERMSRFKEWGKLFLRDGRFPYLPYVHGIPQPQVFTNKRLAKCLKAIAEGGRDAFYNGWIGQAIADELQANGGLITREDLAIYKPIAHEAGNVSYRDIDVLYDPTHSGTTMMQILNIIEGYDMGALGYGSPEAVHLMAEAIGLAFADRFKYMGDPGYIDVPLRGLVSKEYAKKLRERIDVEHAGAVESGDPWPHEPECTTALAAADEAGNMVCVNQTLVNGFGCGVVIPGTGIVMNNAMYGLNPEPGHANSIDGRKRRIQNVCPTAALRDGEPYMVLGAPGGRNIQVSVAHVISHVVDHGMTIQDAVDAPRITRETGTVYADSRLPITVKQRLTEMGHSLVWIDPEQRSWGRPVAIHRNPATGMLHGGVYSLLTGYESMAVGY